MSQQRALIFFTLIGMILVSGVIAGLFTFSQPGANEKQVSSNQPRPTMNHNGSLQITFQDTKIKAADYTLESGTKPPCRPFAPITTSKLPEPGSDDAGTTVVKNHWIRNDGTVLNGPLTIWDDAVVDLISYNCDDGESSLLNIRFADGRSTAYPYSTHSYTERSFSEDKSAFFWPSTLIYSDGDLLSVTDSELRASYQIVDLKNNTTVSLPKRDCVSELGYWSGEYLVTYSNYNTVFETVDADSGEYDTSVCVWSKQGNLVAEYSAPLEWTTGENLVLNADFHVIKDLQSLVVVAPHNQTCVMYLVPFHFIIADGGKNQYQAVIEVLPDDADPVICKNVTVHSAVMTPEGVQVDYRFTNDTTTENNQVYLQ